MRHPVLYLAIFAAACLVVTLVSTLATTNAVYRQIAFSQESRVVTPAPVRRAVTIDLRTTSTLQLAATSLVMILPGPRQPIIVSGIDGDSRWRFDPNRPGFRTALRLIFLRWFIAGAALAGVIIWMARRYLTRHYSAPLTALIDTINEFSDDPTVASAIPDAITQSSEFTAAAGALESLQRNTLVALRQRERLADIGEAVAKINHDMRNVLSSATLVADTLIASQDPRVRRAACRAFAGTVCGAVSVDAGLSCRNAGSQTGHHQHVRTCRRDSLRFGHCGELYRAGQALSRSYDDGQDPVESGAQCGHRRSITDHHRYLACRPAWRCRHCR